MLFTKCRDICTEFLLYNEFVKLYVWSMVAEHYYWNITMIKSV